MQKNRIEVTPVATLGDLIDLVSKASSVVDYNMRGQNQRETPIKVEVTMGGKIRAVVLTELDPERVNRTQSYGRGGWDPGEPEGGAL